MGGGHSGEQTQYGFFCTVTGRVRRTGGAGRAFRWWSGWRGIGSHTQNGASDKVEVKRRRGGSP